MDTSGSPSGGGSKFKRGKIAHGIWAFPSDFPGYSKTATLMLEMTNPVNHTGKFVSMDSGFCVLVGIITMHNFGVYGQSLIKKRRYWPKNVPSEAIDSHFANKELGSTKTFRQVFVTKIMSTHGLINEI